ncbi:DoxX family protein [Metabacillus malikii]|uniref:Membrane protein YphA (DoxX/SURF4 family) n=1 Tax=Metabacillus malikii TaxID=1504265 RepID=A0ABT9ZID8_9BACI|nr:DoxX family protein [Metabacillus malikii]MDQ0232047.1 putative membrane protein YphA (DoxX/SURF4 family) [Metabacillus malikii]
MKKQLSTISLIRYVVAYVFIASGLMKLFGPDMSSMFSQIGIPYPLNSMYILAIIELICAALILLHKYVKKAVAVLLAIMVISIVLTKIPLLHEGIFVFAFNARLDIVMVVLLYILYKTYPGRTFS